MTAPLFFPFHFLLFLVSQRLRLHKFPLGEGVTKGRGLGTDDDILAFSLHVASSELCSADATAAAAAATEIAATMSYHLFICTQLWLNYLPRAIGGGPNG